MPDEIDISEEILGVVQDEWARRTLPMPLSSVGSKISEAARVILRGQNITLRRYIADHLRDKIRLVPMVKQGGGVAPAVETATQSDSELEDLYQNRPQTDQPQFFPVVWKAFREPIAEGSGRYLTAPVGRKTGFRDVRTGGEAPPESYPIEPEYIVPHDAPNPNATTVASINKWRESHGVPLERLAYTRQEQSYLHEPEREVRARSSARHDGDLSEILLVLTPEELSRIQIPADIVLAALRRSQRRR
jgi:hypothetical protein